MIDSARKKLISQKKPLYVFEGKSRPPQGITYRKYKWELVLIMNLRTSLSEVLVELNIQVEMSQGSAVSE